MTYGIPQKIKQFFPVICFYLSMVSISPIIKGVVSPVKIACRGTSQAKYKEFSAIVESFNSALDEFVKGKEFVTKKELKKFYKGLFPGLRIKVKNFKQGMLEGADALTLPAKKSITLAYKFNKGKVCNMDAIGFAGKETIKHETNHMIFFSTKSKPTFIDEISRAFKFRKNNILFKQAFKNQSAALRNNFYTNKLYSGKIFEISKEEVLKMPGFVKQLNEYISKNAQKGKNAQELTEEFFKLNNITREKAFSKKAFRQELRNFFKVNNIPNYEKNIYLKEFYKNIEAEKFAYADEIIRNSKSPEQAAESLQNFEKVFEFDKKLKVLRGERARAILNERRMLHNGRTQPVQSFLETFKPLLSGNISFYS